MLKVAFTTKTPVNVPLTRSTSAAPALLPTAVMKQSAKHLNPKTDLL